MQRPSIYMRETILKESVPVDIWVAEICAKKVKYTRETKRVVGGME